MTSSTMLTVWLGLVEELLGSRLKKKWIKRDIVANLLENSFLLHWHAVFFPAKFSDEQEDLYSYRNFPLQIWKWSICTAATLFRNKFNHTPISTRIGYYQLTCISLIKLNKEILSSSLNVTKTAKWNINILVFSILIRTNASEYTY